MPCDDRQLLPLRTAPARESIGKQGFHIVVILKIPLVGKPVDEGNKSLHPFPLQGILHIEILVVTVGLAMRLKEIVRQGERFR